MKIPLYITILLLVFGCNGKSGVSKPKEIIANDVPIKENLIKDLASLRLQNTAQDYASVKKSIAEDRVRLQSEDVEVDSLSKVFEISLLNKIIPFWEGTKWSFEGHTSIPKSGTIACGYFVSTTLQDIGLNVNRYQLAQQSPINEAKSLAVNMEVKTFSEGSNSQNIIAINQYLKEGIHFIGFDESHVGYILKENNNLYLIHSNYIDAAGVEIEPIEQSEVFNSYHTFHLVELSSNEHFLKNWIRGNAIQIIKK